MSVLQLIYSHERHYWCYSGVFDHDCQAICLYSFEINNLFISNSSSIITFFHTSIFFVADFELLYSLAEWNGFLQYQIN